MYVGCQPSATFFLLSWVWDLNQSRRGRGRGKFIIIKCVTKKSSYRLQLNAFTQHVPKQHRNSASNHIGMVTSKCMNFSVYEINNGKSPKQSVIFSLRLEVILEFSHRALRKLFLTLLQFFVYFLMLILSTILFMKCSAIFIYVQQK